jgi:ankyrin repeat protein
LGHWKLTALFCSEEIDADPNVTDIKNFTPLHYACLAGNAKDARILLNSGSNVLLQNYVSNTEHFMNLVFENYVVPI